MLWQTSSSSMTTTSSTTPPPSTTTSSSTVSSRQTIMADLANESKTTTTSTTTTAPSGPAADSCAALVVGGQDPYNTNGQDFDVQCNTGVSGSFIDVSVQPSFRGCIDACSLRAGCTGVTFRRENSVCALALSIGSLRPDDDQDAARIIPASTPPTTPEPPTPSTCSELEAAGQDSYNGFDLECNTDYSGPTISSGSASSYRACIDSCTGECRGIEWNRQASFCTLFSSIVNAGGTSAGDAARMR